MFKQFTILSFLVCLANNVYAVPEIIRTEGRFVISDVVEEVLPAVVKISVEEQISDRQYHKNPFAKPQSSQVENYKGIKSKKNYNIGSGVIISKDGLLITNYHVVELADVINIKTSDDKKYKAKLIGYDSKTDLALLKIIVENKEFKFVSLADSDKVRLGEVVVAMGNPYGLEGSISMGIISARNRNIGSNIYDDFLQTDASINPGNSGGPLFNLEGHVVGINTAIFSKAGGSNGIGFAVPSNTVKVVIDQLETKGKVIRGWLGIQAQKVDSDIAKTLGLDSTDALLVSEVVKNSPAEKAHIQSGDIILTYNHKKISSLYDLPRMVAETPINSEVVVSVLRNSKNINLKAKILSTEQAAEIEHVNTTVDALQVAGLFVTVLNEQLKEDFNISLTKGIVIVGVESKVGNSDVKPGDVILQIDQQKVETMQDVARLLDFEKKESALLFINRQGEKIFKVLKG